VDLLDDYDESVQGLWLNGQPIAGTIDHDPENERFATGIGTTGIYANIDNTSGEYLISWRNQLSVYACHGPEAGAGLAFVGLIQTHES
jgi:hypothetical protein